jgi:hypothetical protein
LSKADLMILIVTVYRRILNGINLKEDALAQTVRSLMEKLLP